MANLQQTYSGDLTSALAGAIANKVINAAGMAKEQKEKSAKDNVTSQPGSLFASALGHEFGGDLFNRTLGNFSSKIPFNQTDPSSSKEARFRAKFPGNTDGPVQKAEDKLKEDDGSLPVSDAQVRKFASKLLGANVEKKLNVVEFSVNQLSGEIRSLNSTLGSTQNLIFDQNQMLASKFDQILEVFSTNRQFQEEIVEKGKAERKEVELEKEQDLSSAVKLATFDKPESKSGNNFIDALQRIRALADKKKLNLFKDLLDNVKKPGRVGTAAIRNVLLMLGGGKKWKDKSAKAFESFYKSSMRDFQYDTRTPMQKSGYNTTDDFLEGLTTGNINIGKEGQVKVKAKPQRQGKELLESMLGVPPGLFGDAPMGVTEKLGREAADTLQSNMIYMTRVIGNDVPVDKLGEALQDPKRFSKLQQQLQREMGMGLSEEVAKDILTQASALKTDFAQKSGKLATETAEAVAARATTKAGAEAFVKGNTKSAKMLGKASKFTPGVGTGIALTEAAFRLGTGDPTGAALSVLSAIPVAGWAFTAIDIARDMGYNPLGLPEYETGTGYTQKGPGILHGTEARITDKNRSDLNNSVLDSFNYPINYLASATQSFASKTGTARAVSSMIKDSGVSYDFVNVPFSPDVGNIQQASAVREPSRAIERLIGRKDRLIFDKLDDNNMDTPPPIPPQEQRQQQQPQANQPQTNLHIPTGKTSITFSKEQGVDASGEPGVDFSFEDYKSNYSLFDGVVVETGKLYGSGYGNVVTIRSKDANGREFDAMYAHFGDGTIAVKAGQKVKAGDYLGPVGWDEANGRPAPGAGNMTGPHTSLDFFEPNTKPGEVTGPFTDRGPIIESILQGGVPSTEGGGGGIGGPGMMGPQSPMNNADYYSLLAISALEDDDDQGRADVAQALYNRLEGHRAGSNYYQKNNTLKSHIVAKDQFQPTFYNKADWHRIVDMETAITALVMSKKGRARGWTRDYALQVLNDTEKALLNPELQDEAASHVKGRTYFLGTSEQGNMQAGDVLRNPDDNFFSMWYDEDNPYGSNGVPPAAAIPPRMIAPDPGPLPPPPPIAPPDNQWWDMLDLFPNQSKLNEMERISSNMDEMEDGIPVQMVVVNNTILKNEGTTNISSSKSFDNPVRRYQMAVLGA